MKKILAIDDKKNNLTTIKGVITSNIPDCKVLTALSGKKGIEIARKEQPDIILLDVIMPHMNGYETCRKLKVNELTKHIPVIMITAIDTDPKSRIKGLEIGADAFLSKPIDPVELSAQVNVMLRIKEAEDKLRWEKNVLSELVLEKTKELRIINKDLRLEILEHKQAEDKLSKAETNLKNTFNISPDLICIANVNTGYFTECNPAVTKILGISVGEITSKPFVEFIHPDDRQRTFDAITKQQKGRSITMFENRFRCKDRSYKWLAWHATAADKDGKVYAVAKDITDYKNVEQDLKKALIKATESDRLKLTFLATMSHELRTPLNSIIGFSDIIDEALPLHEIIEFNKIINISGKHLLTIVENLFDITLIESGEIKIVKEDVKLKSVLNDVQNIIKIEQQKTKKNHLDLNLIIPSEARDIIVNTDPSKLKQILINLLNNALKFTNEGHVHFGYSLKMDYDPGSTEQCLSTKVKFFVKDTGIGIPKEMQEIIFDMFRQVDNGYTRNYGGTGIGLSISKKLTELLGGKIWLESEEWNQPAGLPSTVDKPADMYGKAGGSTFYFTIPYEGNEITSNTIKTETKNNNMLKDKTILVVEDVDSSFEFLKVVLEKSGINTIWAKNGKESIKICKENPNIDLVLMDINMPVMNGYEATKEIKRTNPDIPIIAQTAYAVSGDKEKALNAGCNDYISKPINRKILKEKLLMIFNN